MNSRVGRRKLDVGSIGNEYTCQFSSNVMKCTSSTPLIFDSVVLAQSFYLPFPGSPAVLPHCWECGCWSRDNYRQMSNWLTFLDWWFVVFLLSCLWRIIINIIIIIVIECEIESLFKFVKVPPCWITKELSVLLGRCSDF